MTFTEKFKTANSKLAAGSVKTYLSTIRRLANMAGKDSIPETGSWLVAKGLLGKVTKLPINARKSLATSAVKASKIYGKVVPAWEKLMRGATRQYETDRDKQQKTSREKELWTDYSKIYKAGQKLWQDVPKDPAKWSFATFRKAQQSYLLLLYGKHTPRLLETLKRPGKKGPNQLRKKGKGFDIILREYKVSRTRGASTFKLDSALDGPTEMLVKAGSRLLKHDYVFANAKGQPLSKPSFSKLITSSMRRGGLKGVSAQLLRVFKASSNRELIEKAKALEQEFGHSSKENVRYAKK